MFEQGDAKVFNPNKEIAREIILEVLVRHRDAFKQARTGELVGIPLDKIEDNSRKINQVRALNLIISAQREMVTISSPIIFSNCENKWRRKYKDDKDRDEHPFELEENDYQLLMHWKGFLMSCEKAIISAEKSKTIDDDFMIIRQDHDGEFNELTENFFDMLNDIETSYEQIYRLMIKNKIVSAGIEEDEELTYKEKEQEAIRRVVEA